MVERASICSGLEYYKKLENGLHTATADTSASFTKCTEEPK